MSTPNIPIEVKKAEAIRRMKKLGIYDITIQQFADEGYVSISEPPFGAYYWLEGDDLERIRKLEKKHNLLVYSAVRTHTGIGVMDAYLCVTDDEEEWEYAWDDLNEGIVFSYVYNRDYPEMSEFGSIGVKLAPAAGLVRVW